VAAVYFGINEVENFFCGIEEKAFNLRAGTGFLAYGL
jgi:hypothetical protein